MKIFKVARKAEEEGGEYVLGSRDTGTHACYMVYGTMKPGEEGRLIKPGHGHEELMMVMSGELKLSGPGIAPVREIVLSEGSAFHIAGDSECHVRNDTPNQAVYVCAGGHTPGGKHH